MGCYICGKTPTRPAHESVCYNGVVPVDDAQICFDHYMQYSLPHESRTKRISEQERARLVPPYRFEVHLYNTDDVNQLKYSHFVRSGSTYDTQLHRERVFWIRDNSRGRLLDCGCHPVMSDLLSANAGLDIYSYGLKAHKAHAPKRTLFWASVHNIPCQVGEFDTIVMGELLEHMPQDKAVQALTEALRVSGYVVATIPNFGDYCQLFWNTDTHIWEAKEEDIHKAMSLVVPSKYELAFTEKRHFFLLKVWR